MQKFDQYPTWRHRVQHRSPRSRKATIALLGLLMCSFVPSAAIPQESISMAQRDVDRRAARIVDSMTLTEQSALLRMVSGASLAELGIELPDTIPASERQPRPVGARRTAGYVPGIPRVDFPALHLSDASLGVADLGILRPDDHATALPSSLSLAATFDPAMALRAGTLVGSESFSKGFNVQLAGGVNLARDYRNGRNFEYLGEDPLLAGVMVAQQITGIQNNNVASTIKHLALNAQESGRTTLDARLGEAAMRESDLLAFEIGIKRGKPASVMCAYNKVNGDWACENDFLMRQVLKRDWAYPGWVMSDWGAVHDFGKSVRAGLDQQAPQGNDPFLGLQKAVERGEIPRAQVRDMAYRIARSMIAVGALDRRAEPGGAVDLSAHAAEAQRLAEAGIVLLKNNGILPLAKTARTIAVIGRHADTGVPAGGGSSLVSSYRGVMREVAPATPPLTALLASPVYHLSSPLKALRAALPASKIVFDDGSDPARAARIAKAADMAVVYAVKLEGEGLDSADLSLPFGQDAMIDAVGRANPATVVVLETGNPVTMPWLDRVDAVLEAWYPGERGGEAIAAILTGAAEPSGRLPVTFPASTTQLPFPALTGFDAKIQRPLGIGATYPFFSVNYPEGSDVGYRWFERQNTKPLFPFGYGLTYTHFGYDRLTAKVGRDLVVKVRITNVGKRAGTEVAQLYVAPPGRTHRLAGWAKVLLQPGESREVEIKADPWLLLSFDESGQRWTRPAGKYAFFVGQSAADRSLSGNVQMGALIQSVRR